MKFSRGVISTMVHSDTDSSPSSSYGCDFEVALMHLLNIILPKISVDYIGSELN